MKKLINNFRQFLSEGQMSDYDKDGVTELYHYADMGYHGQPDELVIDPSRFGGSSYSRNEKERSNFPRSFFYLDPQQRERNVAQGKTLYTYDIPTSQLYDFRTDPMGYDRVRSEENPNGLIGPDNPTKRLYKGEGPGTWGELFEEVSKNYDGMFYSLHNFDVVVLFKPVAAKRIPSDEQRTLEQPAP